MNLKKILKFLGFFLCVVCVSSVQASPNPGKPLSPFRIAGNLYFIGDTYTASYLLVTSQGNILINSGYVADVPKMKANIEKLGFHYKDTKILLISHAHADHCGGSALIKKETGAKYEVMKPDVPVVESGGKADFNYGQQSDPDFFYSPAEVDQVLNDGDEVKLGGTVLVAHLTPGHTPGCTTWTLKLKEKNKAYQAVIVGSPYVNPGYQLVNNTAYPKIADDYKHMFEVLKSLPCDIFLGAHGAYFDLEKKYALLQKGQMNAFLDRKGYKKFVALREKDFYSELSEGE